MDGRSDLYSLGVILYRMISGRKPFYGGRDELLQAHLHETPAPPSEFAHVSPALEQVILRMLAKEPADCYQTGAEFVDALDHVESVPPAPRHRVLANVFWVGCAAAMRLQIDCVFCLCSVGFVAVFIPSLFFFPKITFPIKSIVLNSLIVMMVCCAFRT